MRSLINQLLPDVIKVSVVHHKGTLKNAPKFELNEDQGYIPEIKTGEDFAEMTSGSTKVRIKKGFDWDVEFSYKGKRLTGGAWRATSYIEENQFRADNRINSMRDDSFWSYPADEHNTYIREQLTLGIGECIYGFGEKFTTFVKNGQNVEMWNSDGGTCSDQSYKCVPFYISSNGYGVFVNSSDKVSYEIASDTVSKVSITRFRARKLNILLSAEKICTRYCQIIRRLRKILPCLRPKRSVCGCLRRSLQPMTKKR